MNAAAETCARPIARNAFSFSRDLEFATEPELSKRMGCARTLWLRAAIKELIDNCLDAAEEAGLTPEVAIEVDGERLTVADRGPGMSAELVERLCVRSERTSTREAYAAPDRGAQGNALQVIMALPLGFGRDRAVTTITSRGVEHRITLDVNRLEQRIDVERTVTPVENTPGTTVGLAWPGAIPRAELVDLLREFAGLNPHARFTLAAGAPWNATWRPTGPITKWTAHQPTPIHWYSSDRFEHRVLLELRREPAITVGQFVGTFAGLTDRSKRARVAEKAGLQYQRLDVLLDGTRLDQARAQMFRTAMQSEAREPKPAALGAIGKEPLEAWLRSEHLQSVCRNAEGFAYHIVDGVDINGIPWRWEVGFAHLPAAPGRQLLVGQNFSPAIAPEIMLTNAIGWVSDYLGWTEPILLIAHRISPSRRTLDYGKSRLEIDYREAAALREAIKKVTANWIKLRKREARGHSTGTRDLSQRPPHMSIRTAVWQELPGAYARASSDGAHPVRARQIYYAIRPKVLELTGRKVLADAYFSAQLLPEFMQTHPEVVAGWRVLFDPRGTLTEPHTGRTVPLGTAGVADYRRAWTNGIDPGQAWTLPEWSAKTVGPHNRFAAVIIAEKEGIADLFAAGGVGTRYDTAIVGGKGHATEAALVLADHLCLPLFMLHDFDRSGMVIADNLKTGTWRHRYSNQFPVIDVGLRLHQIEGLESEPVDKNQTEAVGDDRLRTAGATEAEIEFLAKRRVELNALTTKALVDLLEAALIEYGVGKVVPASEDLTNAWRAAKAQAEINKAIGRANAHARRWADAEAPADLVSQVRALLEADPAASWDAALRRIATL